MRPDNFGAGPAALPEAVLREAQAELLDWQGSGMSVLEMSHRSTTFKALVEETLADCRRLLNVPNNYHILFAFSPARGQFSAVPMNLFARNARADYLDTGFWSALAAKEAARFGDIHIAASSAAQNYCSIPARETWQLRDEARYFFYCANETIDGNCLPEPPADINVPIVSDMTSCLFAKPIDVSQYGIIFAGTQKNIAPAGSTLVIVRDDLLDEAITAMPSIWEYRLLAKSQSLLNTPAVFSIYMAAKMFKWLEQQGGLAVMQSLNDEKARRLYACIDADDFYINDVDISYRSTVNVVFQLQNEALTADFLAKADAAGLKALKGHRSKGGCRASLYNSIELAAVDRLCQFMQDFAAQHRRGKFIKYSPHHN